MLTFAFWTCLASLLHVYFFYAVTVRAIVRFRRCTDAEASEETPDVSVVVAARNEQHCIVERLENLRRLDYPVEQRQLVVACDGSEDDTPNIARRCAEALVLEYPRNRGRAATHNDAVRSRTASIVVFTDANTQFDSQFLREIVRPFADPNIGCVVGNLVYRTSGAAVSEAEGFYWRSEKRLRRLECQAGLLATATGACMAVRRSLWRELEPIDDSDFTTPLDVLLQGFRVAYAPRAVAYDEPADSPSLEFQTRVRQTSKNLAGTIRRWGWRGCIRRPLLTYGLISHKILRWLSPYFLLGLFATSALLAPRHRFFAATLTGQTIGYLFAVVGALGAGRDWKWPVASTAWSFVVAQAGMAVGVYRAVMRNVPASFQNGDREIAATTQTEVDYSDGGRRGATASIAGLYGRRFAQQNPCNPSFKTKSA